jgi:cytochrome b
MSFAKSWLGLGARTLLKSDWLFFNAATNPYKLQSPTLSSLGHLPNSQFSQEERLYCMVGHRIHAKIGANMRNRLIYDLPTRLFHWIFAGLFIAAFLIAKTVDDESPVFSYHMLAGILLAFTVCLRLLWGLFGSKYARFDSFSLYPRDLVAYLKGILSGDKRKWAGHNPASSWAAVLMLALSLGLGLTGYLMASGQRETFEDIHELLANAFLVMVLMHIAGVAIHALRHRDGIAMAMIDGAKSGISQSNAISKSRPAIALLFIGLIATFAALLAKNFDSEKQTLNFFATSLQLGDNEEADDAKHKPKVDAKDDANRGNEKGHD